LTHVSEHDAVVGGIEGAFDVRVHDVDVFVVYFCVLQHHDDGGEGVMDTVLDCWRRNPSSYSLRMPWVYAQLEPASLISAVQSLSRLFMRAMGQ
jgi:hypothetical protein